MHEDVSPGTDFLAFSVNHALSFGDSLLAHGLIIESMLTFWIEKPIEKILDDYYGGLISLLEMCTKIEYTRKYWYYFRP